MVIIASLFMGGCIDINAGHIGIFKYTERVSEAKTPKRTIPIWIDKNFGNADQVEIQKAIDKWNYALNGYIVLKVVNNKFGMEISEIEEQKREKGWLFLRVDSNNPIVPIVKNNRRTLGWANEIGGDHLYIVRDLIGNEDVYGITSHEIGHLLGSAHTDGFLMNETYSKLSAQCIDVKAVENVSRYQNIPIEHMNYCIVGMTGNSKLEINDNNNLPYD